MCYIYDKTNLTKFVGIFYLNILNTDWYGRYALCIKERI